MDGQKSRKFDLKRLSQGGAFCGAPIGGGMGPTDMLAASASSEAVSLTLVSGALLGAGIWTFRRWGKAAEALPEDYPEARPEDGVATS